MGGKSFTSACQIKRWSSPSSYQCEAMSRKPLGPAQAMLESICVKVWLGILFQCFAESDQEALNGKLALAVGQVTDFSIVSDEFLCFAARAQCGHGGTMRRRRPPAAARVRRHG